MGWTILRPVAFMENFDGGFLGKIFATAWKNVVKSRPLQLIATADIGTFAAKALLDPASFDKKSISLAGDELTYKQLRTVYKQARGTDVPTTFGIFAKLVLWMSTEMSTMFNFFEKEGYGADIEELRKTHPELQNLTAWLKNSK